jgi:hypothetical protein
MSESTPATLVLVSGPKRSKKSQVGLLPAVKLKDSETPAMSDMWEDMTCKEQVIAFDLSHMTSA